MIAFSIDGAATAPRETETMTIQCGTETQTITNTVPKIGLAAIFSLNIMEFGVLEENGLTTGNPLSTWVSHPDGSISRTFTSPKNVSVILKDGVKATTQVLSQNNEIKLFPIYEPAK